MTDYETIYQDARAKEFSRNGNRAPARVVQKAGLAAVVAAAKTEALAPILALHKAEKRFRPEGNHERSWDTLEEAREHSYGDYEGVWSFEVCAECGRVELEQLHDHADEWGYCESLWPCKTFKATR